MVQVLPSSESGRAALVTRPLADNTLQAATLVARSDAAGAPSPAERLVSTLTAIQERRAKNEQAKVAGTRPVGELLAERERLDEHLEETLFTLELLARLSPAEVSAAATRASRVRAPWPTHPATSTTSLTAPGVSSASDVPTSLADEPGHHLDEPLLTAREVGQRLGLAAKTVMDKARAGVLPSFRVPGGNRVRFRWSEIEAALLGKEGD